MRCPKCGSSSFDLTEVFEEVETREVVNGVVAKEAIDHQPGGLLSASCTCRCGHHWTPRRASVEALERAWEE